MSAEEVSKLTDMGFSYDQAVQALKATNNVEQAISYLFEEPVEIQPEPEKENKTLVKYEDTVSVSNPQDIPSFSQYNTEHNEHIIEGKHEYRFEDQQDSGNYDGGITMKDNTIGDVISESIPEERTDHSPPLIVVKKAKFFENYLIPLIVVLSQIDKFKAMFMSKEAIDYGKDKDWFNFKSKLEIKIPEDTPDEEVSEYKFIIEVQRIIAYLDGLSRRRHICSSNINKSFPNDFKSDLALKIDELEDLVLKFYKSLENSYTNFFKDDRMANFFDSHVESVSDEVSNGLSILTVDSEARAETIYDCLNEMFWNDEDKIGEIRFVDIAPVLTIQILGDDRDYSVKSFTISEYFYPEIYSKKYSDTVVDMNKKRTDAIGKRNWITRELINLSSFEGKSVRHILDTTINQLGDAKELDGAADLKRLSESIGSEKEKLSQMLSQANEEYSRNDVKNYENILETITASEQPNPTPYILLGIIVSDTEYIYRDAKSKGNNNWIYFKQLHASNMNIYDYRLEKFSFDDAQQFTYEIMKDPESSIVLMYSSMKVYGDSQQYEIPSKLQKFFEEDNNVLLEEIANMSLSSSSSEANSPKSSSLSRSQVEPERSNLDGSKGTSIVQSNSELDPLSKSPSQTPDIVEL